MRIFLDPKRDIDAALLSYRRIFGVLALFSGVINLLMLIPSLYMMQVFDRVLTSRNETTLWMLTLMVVGLFLFGSLLEWTRNQVMLKMSAGLDQKLGERIFSAAFERSLKERNSNPAQLLSDLTTVRQFLTGQGLTALMDAPWLPIYLLIAFLFHPWLGLFTLVGMINLVSLAVWNELATRKSMAEANQLAVNSATYVNSTLQNSEIIQAMGMLKVLQGRWSNLQNRIISAQIDASDQSSRITSLSKFVRTTWQSLALGLGALLVLEQQISSGSMIAVSLLLGRAMAPMELLIGSWKQLGNARISYERLTKLLFEQRNNAPPMPLPPPTGAIRIEQLVVCPPGNPQPVINGVNFSLEKGEILAVIGPSASGKSSLARAMLGVWPCLRGSIRFDDADINQWTRAALGPYLGYLPQDIELFNGSVAENIARFGDIDSSEVIEAARLAGIHEMILHFPKGYDTLLGTTGIELSGGQKQRIGLARALYRKPVFIVLDEPNSNLDESGDLALLQALRALKTAGSTVIMITHRPSVLSVVDKLLFMKDGIQQLFGPRDLVLKALLPPAANKPVVVASRPRAAAGQTASTSAHQPVTPRT
jgi:ATP-binding cassette subfamily C exporter for protease/lipase